MKRKPKILFAAFEAEPFMKTGGLGDVGGSLPKALQQAGVNVRLIMPKFDTIPEKYKARMRHVADFYLDLSWRHVFCGVETLRHNGVTCYFIDNEYYFKRGGSYGYNDDGERAAFFSKAVLECLKYLPDFFPDIIHCHDWHAALIPCFLKDRYSALEKFSDIRTMFTVHNLKYQGIYPKSCAQDILGMSDDTAKYLGLVSGDTVNYMRGGICMADVLTTVSPTYANEICTPFYGEKMDEIFNSRRSVLHGILNGINTKSFDPATDKFIYQNYDMETPQGKQANKEKLQAELGLPVDADIPLITVISRLTPQKGLDLLLGIIRELLGEDIQMAVLGVGDKKYEDAFRTIAGDTPDKFAACIAFDEAMSRKFYAASDMVLVPSLFEPCGLTQMIAMRYGALPVVRETGGLRDSVKPYNKHTGEGTGFSFSNYNAHELLFTLKKALEIYRTQREAWDTLVQNAFAEDFSWSVSAEKYVELYKELLPELRKKAPTRKRMAPNPVPLRRKKRKRDGQS